MLQVRTEFCNEEYLYSRVSAKVKSWSFSISPVSQKSIATKVDCLRAVLKAGNSDEEFNLLMFCIRYIHFSQKTSCQVRRLALRLIPTCWLSKLRKTMQELKKGRPRYSFGPVNYQSRKWQSQRPDDYYQHFSRQSRYPSLISFPYTQNVKSGRDTIQVQVSPFTHLNFQYLWLDLLCSNPHFLFSFRFQSYFQKALATGVAIEMHEVPLSIITTKSSFQTRVVPTLIDLGTTQYFQSERSSEVLMTLAGSETVVQSSSPKTTKFLKLEMLRSRVMMEC